MAGKPVASALADGDAGSYDTAEKAAIAGLRSIKETKTEYGGGVLYNPQTQKYAYTQPVGQGDGSHFGARIAVPQGWQLHSIYHTHPQGPASSVFSADDVDMATQLKRPSYILSLADDHIRKFDPSDPASNKVNRNSFDPTRSYATGQQIEEGPIPDGVPKAHPGTVLMPKASATTVNVQGSMAAPPNGAAPPTGVPPALSDDQKTQLADLYDEAQRTGDAVSMGRIRSVLRLDNERAQNQKNMMASMSPAERYFAGFGKQIADWGHGLQQIMSSDPTNPETGETVDNSQARAQLDQNIAESRRLDQPLTKDTAGMLGSVSARAAPFFLAPGAGAAGWAGAAGVGAAEGAADPVLGNESRAMNAGTNALGALAGQAAGKVVGTILRPVGNYLVGARDAAVQVLKDAGIPLDAFQQTGSKFLRTIRNAADDNPLIPPSEMPTQQAQAFTKAALGEMGVNATEATPQVMNAGKQVLKQNYNAIAARNQINVDPVMGRDLYQLQSAAEQSLNKADADVIKAQIKNIYDGVRTGTNPGQGTIGGDRYQAIMQALDRVPGDGGKAPFVTDLRRLLTDALRRSASPQDQALLARTDQQYGAMKQIERAIGPDNYVNPNALFNAMDTVARTNQSVYGQGSNQQLMQLAQAGKLILGAGSRTPNSGTVQRAAGMALFGGVGAAADSRYRGGSGLEPWLAGLITGVAGPAALRAAIENPAVADGIRKWATSQGIKTVSDVSRYLTSRGASGFATQQAEQAGQQPQ